MNHAAVVLLTAGVLLGTQPGGRAQIVAPANARANSAAAPVIVPPPAAVQPGSPGQRISLGALDNLDKSFDRKLQAYNPNDPIDLLGTTRGMYLSGYGAVFTTELSPVITPGITPFQPTISDKRRKEVHERKAARIADLRNLIMAMMRDSAASLKAMPENEQVVVAVRFLYLPWEDTAGLPNLIVMKADRHRLLSGNGIQTEEQ
jgi:hypothetical protein